MIFNHHTIRGFTMASNVPFKFIAHFFLALLFSFTFASLPTLAGDDEATIELGKSRFGEKCGGFCHGAGGKGARAPCLICGKFKHGETDDAIARNISEGIPNTAMGAFSDKLNGDEVKAIVAFLREQQKKKAEAAQ
jgi:mono/diheme cytochrome c family protein